MTASLPTPGAPLQPMVSLRPTVLLSREELRALEAQLARVAREVRDVAGDDESLGGEAYNTLHLAADELSLAVDDDLRGSVLWMSGALAAAMDGSRITRMVADRAARRESSPRPSGSSASGSRPSGPRPRRDSLRVA